MRTCSCSQGTRLMERLKPAQRLMLGLALLAFVALWPLESPVQFAGLAALVLLWLRLGRLRGAHLLRALGVGMAFLGPLSLYILVTGTWQRALEIAWRTLFSMLTSVSTCSLIPLHQVDAALAPLPRLMRLLLRQIILQTALLWEESRRITHALVLRGIAWRVAFNFPLLWLGRLLLKAERVAAAMEVRGFE